MHRAKSIYVSLYSAAAMAVAALATARLIGGAPALAWAGVLATVAPFLSLLGFLMLTRSRARTSSSLPLVTAATLAGAAVTTIALVRGSGSWLTFGLAAGGAAAYLLYDFWYSRLDRADAPALAVGQTLPDLRFESATGEPVWSRELRGAPALLMFYRGNWCPLCMAQVKEIAAQYRELADRGVRVALVSPQPHHNTARLAERFEVPFRFLVDPDNRAARALGIVAEGGLPLGMEILGYDSDTVLPTVIITDGNGRVLFSDQTDNYRVRPEPATFLAVLDRAGAVADTHAAN